MVNLHPRQSIPLSVSVSIFILGDEVEHVIFHGYEL